MASRSRSAAARYSPGVIRPWAARIQLVAGLPIRRWKFDVSRGGESPACRRNRLRWKRIADRSSSSGEHCRGQVVVMQGLSKAAGSLGLGSDRGLLAFLGREVEEDLGELPSDLGSVGRGQQDEFGRGRPVASIEHMVAAGGPPDEG